MRPGIWIAALQFALAASHLALQDAALGNTFSEEERERMGVYMGTAMASVEEGERIWQQVTDNGTRPYSSMNLDQIPANLLMTHASASCIAAHSQLYGPCMVIATGCSAGADAIGQAFWAIQEGRGDRMLAGGCDSAISPISLDVFCVMGALSTNFNDEPQRASRPYDQKRDGFVMAEGAAVMLLEKRELALARGAHIYAEILAFSSNSNAYHMTSLTTGWFTIAATTHANAHRSWYYTATIGIHQLAWQFNSFQRCSGDSSLQSSLRRTGVSYSHQRYKIAHRSYSRRSQRYRNSRYSARP